MNLRMPGKRTEQAKNRVPSIAAAAQYYGEYLSRNFYATTMQTVYNYRTEHKLSEALNLLLKSNFSCKEIEQKGLMFPIRTLFGFSKTL